MRNYAGIAERAVAAARAQLIVLPGQDLAATIISELATNILDVDERVKALDTQIATTFEKHPQAAIITSMPGFGPILGASLLVGAGDLAAFPSGGHLAAAAGLVPVPNDSGRRTGNLHKPRRYNRPLRRVFYLSAQTSMIRPGPSRDYYLKKRGQKRTHNQASSPSPAAEPTSSGHCSATTGPGSTNRPLSLKRLDNTIEIPSVPSPLRTVPQLARQDRANHPKLISMIPQGFRRRFVTGRYQPATTNAGGPGFTGL